MFEIITLFPFLFIRLNYLEGKQNLTPRVLQELKRSVVLRFVLFSCFRYIYTLYLMSDCYLGLDQQYDIHLNVTPASISAQVNEEVSVALTDLEVK